MGLPFLAVVTGEGADRMRGEPEPNGKMTKGELENLLRAFRLNAKAAKTSVVNLGAKLKAEFDVQLNTTYPPMVIQSGTKNIRHC
jgi:hypothetical protein